MLLFLLFVTAVCPSGQPPPSPFLGISPLRAVRTTSVLTLWDRLALPFLSLPAWDTHTYTYTHLTSHACFTCAVWSGSLPGIFTSGRKGESGSLGAKEGQGMPGGQLGHHSLSLGTAASPTPIPGSHSQSPKRWPLFTVRTWSLCLCFLKYEL